MLEYRQRKFVEMVKTLLKDQKKSSIEFWAPIRNFTVLHDIWMEEKLVGKGG